MKHSVCLSFLLLAAVLTACGVPDSSRLGDSESTYAQEREMLAPNAPIVYSESSSLETLSNEDLKGVKVVHKHIFSNGEEFVYTLIDNLVVNDDIVLWTHEDFKTAVAEYEVYLSNKDELSSQGAMAKGTPVDPGSFFDFGLKNDRWPNGVVIYKPPSPSLFTSKERTQIKKAMAYIESATGGKIDFRPYPTNGLVSLHYIEFTSYNGKNGRRGGCWSYLGRQRDGQELNLQSGSSTCFSRVNSRGFDGSIVHELGHALGLIHEHERYDRDQYITSSSKKFSKGKLENITSYDYGSIMHYTFPESACKKSCDNFKIGQRDRLSSKDLQSINKRY